MSGWGTHGCSSLLLPSGIAKVNDVICHNKAKSFNNSFRWNVVFVAILLEESANGCQGKVCIDCCVERNCISGEESSTRREVKVGPRVSS